MLVRVHIPVSCEGVRGLGELRLFTSVRVVKCVLELRVSVRCVCHKLRVSVHLRVSLAAYDSVRCVCACDMGATKKGVPLFLYP